MTTQGHRAKRAVLHRAVESLDATERRLLADLRLAGYRFTSMDQARRHLKKLRTIDQFKSPDDIAEALIETERRRSH